VLGHTPDREQVKASPMVRRTLLARPYSPSLSPWVGRRTGHARPSPQRREATVLPADVVQHLPGGEVDAGGVLLLNGVGIDDPDPTSSYLLPHVVTAGIGMR